MGGFIADVITSVLIRVVGAILLILVLSAMTPIAIIGFVLASALNSTFPTITVPYLLVTTGSQLDFGSRDGIMYIAIPFGVVASLYTAIIIAQVVMSFAKRMREWEVGINILEAVKEDAFSLSAVPILGGVLLLVINLVIAALNSLIVPPYQTLKNILFPSASTTFGVWGLMPDYMLFALGVAFSTSIPLSTAISILLTAVVFSALVLIVTASFMIIVLGIILIALFFMLFWILFILSALLARIGQSGQRASELLSAFTSAVSAGASQVATTIFAIVAVITIMGRNVKTTSETIFKMMLHILGGFKNSNYGLVKDVAGRLYKAFSDSLGVGNQTFTCDITRDCGTYADLIVFHFVLFLVVFLVMLIVSYKLFRLVSRRMVVGYQELEALQTMTVRIVPKYVRGIRGQLNKARERIGLVKGEAFE